MHYTSVIFEILVENRSLSFIHWLQCI